MTYSIEVGEQPQEHQLETLHDINVFMTTQRRELDKLFPDESNPTREPEMLHLFDEQGILTVVVRDQHYDNIGHTIMSDFDFNEAREYAPKSVASDQTIREKMVEIDKKRSQGEDTTSVLSTARTAALGFKAATERVVKMHAAMYGTEQTVSSPEELPQDIAA